MVVIESGEVESWPIRAAALAHARRSTVGLVDDSAFGALASSCAWRPSSARMVWRRLRDPFEAVVLEQWLIVEVRHRGGRSSSVWEQESGRE